MFDKKDVTRLIEQIEGERIKLRNRSAEVQKQLDKLVDERDRCDEREKHLADLVENLSHYHDDTTPEALPL